MERQPSRSQVRSMVCPFCRARSETPCMGKRGKVRESNHRERVDAFIKANPQWNS